MNLPKDHFLYDCISLYIYFMYERVYCAGEAMIPLNFQASSVSSFCSLFRNQGYRVRTSYVFGKLEVPYFWEGNVAGFGTIATLSDRYISSERNNLATWPSSGIYISSHGLSSQAGAENSGEEDGFSELDETLPTTRSEIVDDDDNVVDDGTQNELDLLEGETELAEKKFTKWVPSELTKAIWNASGLSVSSALDKWVSEGNELSWDDISSTMMSLRRRRMFGKALQVN